MTSVVPVCQITRLGFSAAMSRGKVVAMSAVVPCWMCGTTFTATFGSSKSANWLVYGMTRNQKFLGLAVGAPTGGGKGDGTINLAATTPLGNMRQRHIGREEILGDGADVGRLGERRAAAQQHPSE